MKLLIKKKNEATVSLTAYLADPHATRLRAETSGASVVVLDADGDVRLVINPNCTTEALLDDA